MFSLRVLEQLWEMESSPHFTNVTTAPVSTLASKTGTLEPLSGGGMKPQR